MIEVTIKKRMVTCIFLYNSLFLPCISLPLSLGLSLFWLNKGSLKKKYKVKTSPETKQRSFKPIWVPCTGVLFPRCSLSHPVLSSLASLPHRSFYTFIIFLWKKMLCNVCVCSESLLFSFDAPLSYNLLRAGNRTKVWS